MKRRRRGEAILPDDFSHKNQILEGKSKRGKLEARCVLVHGAGDLHRSKLKERKPEQKNEVLNDAVSLPRSKSKGEKSEQNNEILNDKGSVGIGGYPGMRVGGPLGLPHTYMYYDPSSGASLPPSIIRDELLYLSQLAIWSYNIKEVTDYDKVQVLMVKRCYGMNSIYFITFKAFSPDGVAATFQTKILNFLPRPCAKIEIIFVRIRPSDSESDDFAESSQEDHPTDLVRKDKIYKRRLSQLVKTHTDDYQFKLPIYLSQFTLVIYNMADLKAYDVAVHDIPSLKLVKPMKHVRKGTTYRVTFQASLSDDNKIVETFETEIYMPTLFPTTKIEFWNFRI